MPTISDAFHQLQDANTKLDTLHNDVTALKASEDATTAAVNGVRNSVDRAVQELVLLVQGQVYTNQALFHVTQQNDTMICILEHISKNTCMLLNEAHIQTGLQTAIAADTSEALDIDKTVHPEAALDLERREALRKEMEVCCPPKPQPLVCDYGTCPAVKPMQPPAPVNPRDTK
jgi:hypothetical protein